MTGRPLFLLGVGAQKAGTTWLQRYVTGDRSVALPAMKEFHVWNEVYMTDGPASVVLDGSNTEEREKLRRRMIDLPSAYFDYFSDLLRTTGKSLSCDITPAYSGLPPEAFSSIRAGFAERGMDVRGIFLIRDPVERCWSAVRMYRRKGQALPDIGAFPESVDEAVLAYCSTRHARNRGSYEQTVDALEHSLGAENVHVALYETMFEPEQLAALSAFAGVELRAEQAERRYNEGRAAGALGTEARRAVARAYRQTLEYCARRFPETREWWPSYAQLSE